MNASHETRNARADAVILASVRLPTLALLAGFAASTSSTLVVAGAMSGQGSWETTLEARDLDGNPATAEAYYDKALDITWLADANYAAANRRDADGRMTWAKARAWAASLDPYGSGITGWRLPTTFDADGPDPDSLGNDGCSYTNFYQGADCGYNVTRLSEMSHLFYITLGNKAYYTPAGAGPQAGWGLTNSGHFTNVKARYWSVRPSATPRTARSFAFSDGLQFVHDQGIGNYAWAVHAGDVGAPTVPVLLQSDRSSMDMQNSSISRGVKSARQAGARKSSNKATTASSVSPTTQAQ